MERSEYLKDENYPKLMKDIKPQIQESHEPSQKKHERISNKEGTLHVLFQKAKMESQAENLKIGLGKKRPFSIL